MIPRDYITEWRSEAPWVEDYQVEQDLVVSRALIEIFVDALVANGQEIVTTGPDTSWEPRRAVARAFVGFACFVMGVASRRR